MNDLLTDLTSFITRTIKYSVLIDDEAARKLLPDYIKNLQQETKQIRRKIKLHVSGFSSPSAAKFYINENYSVLITLTETLLFYLYEIDAGEDSPAGLILKSFYNQVCEEVEEILVFLEESDLYLGIQ